MLELRGITKRFGAVLANDRIDIVVDPGTIHAIVGENGAGKSTAMRIAFGFYASDSGTIIVNGSEVHLQSPHDAIALGIGMVHQHFTLVDTMTVAENIVLGAEPGSALSLDLSRAEGEIRALSTEFNLRVDPAAFIEDLSVGQQQRVELLKALYRKARLLILDEPTAVLTPVEVEELFNILRRMRGQGKTVVIITHKLSEVMAISDQVTVMRDGKVIGRVKTSETSTPELARMMVGREVLLRVEKNDARVGDVILTVENLGVTSPDDRPVVSDLSLQVRAGEIVGIAAVEGNGQTELIEAIAGLVPELRTRGRMTLAGKPLAGNARERRERGIAHIPEDRHRRGLLLDFDLAENAILGRHYRAPVAGAAGMLDRSVVAESTETLLRDFDVRPPDRQLLARALSGGNQQKLIIGREMGTRPMLLLVSQPTRGVDIGAIEFIHRKLIELRDAGCAILLVSAELEEVTSLADRLLVMHDGKIAGEVDPKRATMEEIGMMMAGGGKKVPEEARA